jgi:hypothetical protein
MGEHGPHQSTTLVGTRHARLLDGFDASKVEVRLFDNA